MAKTVTCSNPKCMTVINTEGKEVGEKVECPKCGTPNKVLADFGSVFDISTIKEPEEGQKVFHPARQTCPNCGALLGVRATICPKCRADIRTGAVAAPTPVRKKKRSIVPLLVGLVVVAAIVVLLLRFVF